MTDHDRDASAALQRSLAELAPRADWAVPLGLGLGSIVVGLLVLAVFVGYDIAGRHPSPYVIAALALIAGPQLEIARRNRRAQRRWIRQLGPLVEILPELQAAAATHGRTRVVRELRGALARLPGRVGSTSRPITRPITLTQLPETAREQRR